MGRTARRIAGTGLLRGRPGRRGLLLAGAAAVLLTVVPLAAQAAPQSQAGKIPVVTGDQRVNKLLSEMTLTQKLTMIEGVAVASQSGNAMQAGELPGIPSLGIPYLTLSDGPPGVETKYDSTGMTSTMGLAATFSTSDAQANGEVIGSDAKALGQNVVLEPFINMDRDTTGGRGWNTYGEDPLLTGDTGASEITGIQSTGTMAQAKHYIAYDGGNNVVVDQQALQEIYLQPFADAVNAGVSSVMCSYNAVNSTTVSSCGDSQTLTAILRNELGFKGFVTSDWDANHATTYLNAGLDMEMPGGCTSSSGIAAAQGIQCYFSLANLEAAIKNGSITEARVTQAVGRILYEYNRFGLLTSGAKHTVTPEDRSADDSVVQQTAVDSATLLRNKGSTLPLSGQSSIALIGPGAGQTIATDGGGEKSGGVVAEQTGTYQVLKSELGSSASLTYSVADDMTGTPIPASALSHDGKAGLTETTTGSKATKTDSQVYFATGAHNALPAGSGHTWTGTLTVPAAGSYWINLGILGANGTLSVDGKAIDTITARYGTVHATDGNGPLPATDGLSNTRDYLSLKAGKHAISLTETADISKAPVQVQLTWVTPAQQKANTAAAVAAAKKAGTAVVFAWDSEDGDLSAPLPEGQDALIEAVAKVNPNTVVVLNADQPVAMPWLSSVKSVLDMYYPGDRGGYATADVLLGNADPGGRLPFTWPASISQELAHQSSHPERSSDGVGTACALDQSILSPWQCPVTTYSEGIDIGYRYFDATGETPLYPFGYGLSYTSFSYSGLHQHADNNGDLAVSFTVTNTGSAAGATVPQVYLGAPVNQPKGVQFAPRALAGYSRVDLQPGQSSTVRIEVPKRQLQYWSTATSKWVTAAGLRGLYVSTDERTNALETCINVAA
jgi:beta-glucosidase